MSRLSRLSNLAESASAKSDTSEASYTWAMVAAHAAAAPQPANSADRLALCEYARRAYAERLHLPWPPPGYEIRGPEVAYYIDGEDGIVVSPPEESWDAAVAAHGCQ